MTPRPPRTYFQVHDGGEPEEEPVANVRPRSHAKSAILLTLATTLVTGAAGIATSRWGGVSKETYDNGRTDDEKRASDRYTDLKLDNSKIKADVAELKGTVAGLNAFLEQQAKLTKRKNVR